MCACVHVCVCLSACVICPALKSVGTPVMSIPVHIAQQWVLLGPASRGFGFCGTGRKKCAEEILAGDSGGGAEMELPAGPLPAAQSPGMPADVWGRC